MDEPTPRHPGTRNKRSFSLAGFNLPNTTLTNLPRKQSEPYHQIGEHGDKFPGDDTRPSHHLPGLLTRARTSTSISETERNKGWRSFVKGKILSASESWSDVGREEGNQGSVQSLFNQSMNFIRGWRNRKRNSSEW